MSLTEVRCFAPTANDVVSGGGITAWGGCVARRADVVLGEGRWTLFFFTINILPCQTN